MDVGEILRIWGGVLSCRFQWLKRTWVEMMQFEPHDFGGGVFGFDWSLMVVGRSALLSVQVLI